MTISVENTTLFDQKKILLQIDICISDLHSHKILMTQLENTWIILGDYQQHLKALSIELINTISENVGRRFSNIIWAIILVIGADRIFVQKLNRSRGFLSLNYMTKKYNQKSLQVRYAFQKYIIPEL